MDEAYRRLGSQKGYATRVQRETVTAAAKATCCKVGRCSTRNRVNLPDERPGPSSRNPPSNANSPQAGTTMPRRLLSQPGHNKVHNDVVRNVAETIPESAAIHSDRPIRAASTPHAISGSPKITAAWIG